MRALIRVLVGLVVGLALVAPASAQIMTAGAACPALDRPLTAYAHEQLTVSSAAKTLTVTTYITGGRVPLAALLSVQSNPVNAIDDGTTATSALGMVLEHAYIGTYSGLYWVCGSSIARLSMIRNSGADATVNVIYYGP